MAGTSCPEAYFLSSVKAYIRLIGRFACCFLLAGLFLLPLRGQEIGIPVFVQKNQKWNVQVQLPVASQTAEEVQNSPTLLKVFVGETPTSPDQPSILGSNTYEGDLLIFSPRFSFQPGVSYRAQYQEGPFTVFHIPLDQPKEAPRLLHIFPSSDTLPANLLKMYLHFSQPMRQGVAYQQLRFLDKNRTEIPLPFLELQPELWDESGQILTLWLDPGRVKRNLLRHQALGPPLEEGETYTLEVLSSWPSIQGHQLEEGGEKVFTTGEEDRSRPEITSWIVHRPGASTSDPLTINFGKPMDQLLAHKTLIVRGNKDQIIEGDVQLEQSEQIWRFDPRSSWEKGIYQILIESRLEDLAGNNLNRLFDRDLSVEKDPPSDQASYSLTIEIQ